jgi:hypothetical protein
MTIGNGGASTEALHAAPGAAGLEAGTIERIVDLLVIQRQEFRQRGAGGEALEANRQQLVYWEQQLASARARPA